MELKNYNFKSLLRNSAALLFFLCTGTNAFYAQVDTWTAKASITSGRRDFVGFAIGAKGYMGTGDASSGNLSDFWEYDPTTNAWTQKANFGGGVRSGAMGFGIGTKGYLGGGYNNTTGLYVTDFYEYDPAGNTWTAKATLPGSGCEESVSFAIGAKGYYGTGFNGNVPPYCTANFYEYDPSANTWTTKASFPSGSRYGSIGFGIGTKGYVGSGSDCVSGDVNTFYEFDPIANTWTAKANYPGATRESATGFSIGSRGYVADGRNSSTEYNDFYEYDPATNVWTLKATPLGGVRLGAVGFGIGSKGYLLGGYDFVGHSGNASYLNDMYEYTACPTSNQVVTPATASAVCSSITNFTVASQAGVNYYLRNSANAVISGPVVGTGSNISLPGGNVTSTSTLNVIGKALSGGLTFDGVDDRVVIPYSSQFNYGTSTDFTYEAMIKCTASQSNYTGIIAKVASGNPFTQLVIYNNRLAAEIFSSSSNIGVGNGLIGTTVLNDGQWHHVALVVTRAANNAKLYVDGVVEADVTNTGVSGNLTESNGTYIGSERGANAFFNGSIDEVRIWNAARSASQLTTNISACLTGTETALLAYYTFENGTGSSTLTDIAGGDNNGTLTNMNTTSAWGYGAENCAGCTYQMATKPVITINALTNRTVTANTSSFCVSGSTTITANGSETGANYYLKDNATGSVVTGPIAGTGSALNFTTGTITSTKVYNVTAKKLSTALTFDGVNDFVKLANQASFDVANLTIETWVFSANYTQSGTIFEKGTFNSQYSLFFDNTNGFYFRTFDNSFSNHDQQVSLATLGLVNGNWYHLAATFDGTTKKIYVNGVLKASVTDPHTLNTGQTGAVIGSFANSSYYFNGKLDEMRIWSNAQTQAQIQANMNACLVGTETGLVAYYKFEDGTTTLTDYAGGDNNGTLSNMAISTAWTTSAVDNCGCTLQMANTPTVTINALPTVSVTSATICSGNSAVITPTGATTYTITGGTFTVTPGTTSTYSVTGTSSAGCVSSNTAVSTISVNLTPTLSVNSATICSGNSVVITPTGAATYSISGGNFTVSPASGTSYSVTGTSTNGCISGNAVSAVSVNITPTLSVNSATICSGSSAVISPSGAASYSITGGNFTVSPGATSSYSVTGTAASGCAASNTIVSTVLVNITPTLSVNNATICSGNSAVISPSGAATYSITGSNFTVSPASTTSYSVTGTSASGCISGNAVSAVSVNITPTLSVNSATICSGNSTVISPTGAASYSITGGTFTVSPASTTSYSVTGTAANGCTGNTAVSSISVNITPTLSVNNATICSGNSAVITPGGATVYNITGGSYTVTPGTTTSYSVTGSSNGCAASNTIVSTVVVNITPTLSVNSATICSGNSVAIAPTGAASYSITGGTFTVSPASTTSYSVTGTAGNGCISGNAVSSVSVNITPTLSVNSATICSGNSVVITPTGAVTFSITGGSFNISPNTTTSYSVTGTAANGCVSGNAVASVSVNATPTISLNSGAMCPGNVFTFTPSGASGGTYTITGGNYTVAPASTTSYTLTGTGANGCPAGNSSVATLTVVNTLTVTVSGATTVCNGSTATLTAGGASTYSWTTGAQTNTVSLSPTANTSYTVYGASGTCSNVAVVTLSVLNTPTVTATSATICSGSIATITPGGITGGTYTITGNSFTVNPLTTTSYSVTGTATNGCRSGNTAVASVSVNLSPSLTVNSATICSNASVVITPTGSAISTFSITGGNFTVTPNTTTSYSVTGTGANGCATSNTAVASVSVNLTPTLSVNNPSICLGTSVVIAPTGAGTYSISGNTFTVSPANTTTYAVTGTGTNNCAAFNTIVATVTIKTNPTLSVNSATLCSGNTAVIAPTGGGTYTITGGNFTVTPATTTSYSVTGTGTNGCAASNTAVATVSVNATPTISAGSGSVCAGSALTILPSGANTYTITGGSFTVTPLSDTSYSVTGTGTNGCVSATAAVANVTVIALPTVSLSNGVICPGNSFTLIPSGANTYTFANGSDVVSPLTTTSYSVTGTSAQGCLSSNTAVATVSVVNTLTITVSGSTTICAGQTTSLTAGGATTYSWTSGDVTSTVSLSPTANTTYTVYGASGTCNNTATVSIVVNMLPSVIVTTSGDQLCVGQTATLTASGANTYSWSTAQTDNVISVTSATAGTEVYLVTGTDSNGCVNTATVSETTALCTGIVKNNAATAFGIYPNPNSGEFVVETEDNTEIAIITSLGQVVYTEKTSAGKTRLSIKQLDNGIYFIRATINGNQHLVKLIKE